MPKSTSEEGRANSEEGESAEAEHRVQSTTAAAVFYTSIYFYYAQHTHTQPLLWCSVCLNLSLFATTLYDQQLREKDTLRGRAGQTKKE